VCFNNTFKITPAVWTVWMRLLQARPVAVLWLQANAHTIASDAQWDGVPHVACTGQSFAARVGAGVLTAAVMLELIAQGLQDYEALAKRLLSDHAESVAVLAKLTRQRGNPAVGCKRLCPRPGRPAGRHGAQRTLYIREIVSLN
jgi:protein O-GlcNAc transferase